MMSDDDSETAERWCKSCGAMHPLSAFYRIKARRYAGGYTYRCKVQTDQRNAAARRNAPADSPMRETIRRANRESIKRNPEANRARVAAHRARKKAQADTSPASEADEP
jgi:hypothetical protein